MYDYGCRNVKFDTIILFNGILFKKIPAKFLCVLGVIQQQLLQSILADMFVFVR